MHAKNRLTPIHSHLISFFVCLFVIVKQPTARRIQTMVQEQVMQPPEVIVQELQKPVPRKILLSN